MLHAARAPTRLCRHVPAVQCQLCLSLAFASGVRRRLDSEDWRTGLLGLSTEASIYERRCTQSRALYRWSSQSNVHRPSPIHAHEILRWGQVRELYCHLFASHNMCEAVFLVPFAIPWLKFTKSTARGKTPSGTLHHACTISKLRKCSISRQAKAGCLSASLRCHSLSETPHVGAQLEEDEMMAGLGRRWVSCLAVFDYLLRIWVTLR